MMDINFRRIDVYDLLGEAERLRDPGLIRRHRPLPAYSHAPLGASWVAEPETAEERELRHERRRALLARFEASVARSKQEIAEARTEIERFREEVEKTEATLRERLVAELALP
jgi:hypothetical protein